MADSFITVAPDSTGKSMQTYENTISGNNVHAEAIVLVDSTGAPITTLPVSIAGSVPTTVTSFTGAANMANGQVTASGSAGTLVAARPTRRSIVIRNTNASINVFIGISTVTAGNGMVLRPGESISIDFTGLIEVIAASGNPIVAYMETYD